MKLKIEDVDVKDFEIRDIVIAGESCVWINPHFEGVKWTEDNLILRSSIWRKSDGELISGGLKKFFNWDQLPTVQPIPAVMNNRMVCVEKVDGSCLIVSQYNGFPIFRTRRALVDKLPNAAELPKLKNTYPILQNTGDLEKAGISLIFEWVSPQNQIVIGYPESDLVLTNIVKHSDYSYYTQREVDDYAKRYSLKRPRKFTFHTYEEMLKVVKEIPAAEGLCIFYGNDQKIRKCKSDWYLHMHAFRSNLTLKSVIELYLQSKRPAFNAFMELITNQYDYECAQQAMPLVAKVLDGQRASDRIVEGMKQFGERHKHLRKVDLYQAVVSAYGKTNRAGIAMLVIEGKELDKKEWAKLLYQNILQ